MKIDTMRFLDKYAGKLILACLIACTRHCKRQASAAPGGIRRILVVKFWGFGSIILAYDLFGVIRAEFPDAQICALTLRQNRPIFEMTGLFDLVVSLDIKNIFRFTVDTVRMIVWARKKAFDISIDLEFSSRFSSAISCLVHAKKRIGFQYAGVWRGSHYSDLLHFQEDVKLKRSYLNIASLMKNNIGARSQPITLRISDAQKAMIDSLMKMESVTGRPVVGYNINASDLCLLRRWPKEYFVVLAETLIKLYSVHVVFIGAREDSHYVDSAISTILPDLRLYTHNFAGRVSLEQLAYCMAKFKLFISNDSGPLHLAAYLKIPTISFFGPETPSIYGPDGDADTVLYKNLGCSPCIRVKNYKNAQCRNNQRCLREIQPESVIDEIRRKRLL